MGKSQADPDHLVEQTAKSRKEEQSKKNDATADLCSPGDGRPFVRYGVDHFGELRSSATLQMTSELAWSVMARLDGNENFARVSKRMLTACKIAASSRESLQRTMR
jgi:hypothetical protein